VYWYKFARVRRALNNNNTIYFLGDLLQFLLLNNMIYLFCHQRQFSCGDFISTKLFALTMLIIMCLMPWFHKLDDLVTHLHVILVYVGQLQRWIQFEGLLREIYERRKTLLGIIFICDTCYRDLPFWENYIVDIIFRKCS